MGARENYDNAVRKSNQLIDTRMAERHKAEQPRFSGALNRESDSDRIERSLKDQKETEVFNREIDKQSLVNRGQLDIQNAQNTGALGAETIRGNFGLAGTKYNVDALTNTANLDRSANSFFKLVDANRGFSTEGNFPRYYGGKGGSGNDIFDGLAQDGNTPAANGAAATGGIPDTILQNSGNTNAATTPAFDIDKTLEQFAQINQKLYGGGGGGGSAFVNGVPADYILGEGKKNVWGTSQGNRMANIKDGFMNKDNKPPAISLERAVTNMDNPSVTEQYAYKSPVSVNAPSVKPQQQNQPKGGLMGLSQERAKLSTPLTTTPYQEGGWSRANPRPIISPTIPVEDNQQPQSKAPLKTPEEIDSYSQAYSSVRKKKPKKPTYLSGGYGKYF